MRTRWILALSCLLALTLAAGAEERSAVGRKVADFTLPDFRGKEHTLAEWKDSKFVVVAFVGTECPLAKLYAPRLAELAKKYEGRGVAFVGVGSNAQDGVTKLAGYARVHDISFPILKDLGNRVADQFGAERTPEVFVLDAERAVRYHGRIDDQYGIGYARDEPRNAYLADALDALLAGKPVARAETEAEGCVIGRVREVKADAEVTYTKDIAPLFNRRCVECHRAGEIAPFELTNYKQAHGWSGMIAEVVRENRMPPWHADPRHGTFANDRRLTEEERGLIFRWVKAGAPEGDPKDLPPAPSFPEGWQLPKKPDVVVSMRDRPFEVPATGAVRYQYFVADPGFKEDKWFKGVEVRAGNREVVHHILVFAVDPKTRRGLSGGGVNGFLAAYVPGMYPEVYLEGMAKRIPANTSLVFQVHYTPNGSPQKDISKIGFLFTDPDKVQYEVKTTSAANRFLFIPPGEDNHEVKATRTLRSDTLLLGFTPHMHVRGKAFRYELETPGGKAETLIDIPEYDFNWQTSYRLAEPRKVAAGTRVRATAHYDNSKDNWNNPDPTKLVRWGDQTWDEMMIGYFDIAVPRGEGEKAAGPVIPEGGVVIPARFARFFKTYDTDGDGKLSKKEIDALPGPIRDRVMEYIRTLPDN